MSNVVKITLAEQEFEKVVDFETSYKLTKYRNRLQYGIEITETDKEIIEDILKIRERVENGEDINSIPTSDFKPETIEFLNKRNTKQQELFSMEELIDMGKILTGIDSDEEIKELYNTEIELNGYDILISLLTQAVAQVFMNAKGGSTAKEKKTKKGIAKVAEVK